MGEEADDISQQRVEFLCLRRLSTPDDEDVGLRIVLEKEVKVGLAAEGRTPRKHLAERVWRQFTRARKEDPQIEEIPLWEEMAGEEKSRSKQHTRVF